MLNTPAPTDSARENAIPDYKAFGRVALLIVFGANGAGSLLTFIYFTFIDPLPMGALALRQSSLWNFLPTVIGTALLLLGGTYLSRHNERYHPEWYERIRKGESADGMPEAARQEVVNYPFAAAFAALAMWLVAGVAFGGAAAGGLRGFLSIFGVGGVLAAAITFFAVERVWRVFVPFFLPDGRVSQVRAVRLPVFGRLVLVFVLIGLYPTVMLALVSLSRARALIGASNPQVIYSNLGLALLFIVVAGSLCSFLLASLVAHSIVSPLRKLQDAMTQVAEHNLAVHLPVESNDELGYVTERFNEMVAGLRQGEMLRNLLNLYVSPEVARAALAEGGAQLGGQVVECTILFSDIRGFTSLSEQLPPQELISLLNRYMSRMVDVVIANGGIVNKFGGDSLLAVFGTPLNPAEDHAARAIRTALHMRRSLAGFNIEQEKNNGPQLQIGIGLASGPAVAGNVGGEGRIEYTVIGDTVNLAARLQSLTKELGREILTNAATVEQAARKMGVAAEPLAPMAVRGKAEPVKIYAIISDFQEQP